MSSFHHVRFALKATAISSLLILGHVLLTTSAHTPYTHRHHGHHHRSTHDHIHMHHAHQHSSVAHHAHQSPYSRSLSILSALIFLTLLWITFTLLEGSDINSMARVPPASSPFLPQAKARRAREDEKAMVFMLTAVEVVCGVITGGAWLLFWKDASMVISFLTSHYSKELYIIPITYNIAFCSVLLLNVHTLWSICSHARNVGIKEIFRRSFWLGRIGWWEERVELEVENDYPEKV
ncbi:hypothetical protein IAR50_005980 [Cryptococcus sp. DSM 104548]